jgi:hypothetical protein
MFTWSWDTHQRQHVLLGNQHRQNEEFDEFHLPCLLLTMIHLLLPPSLSWPPWRLPPTTATNEGSEYEADGEDNDE